MSPRTVPSWTSLLAECRRRLLPIGLLPGILLALVVVGVLPLVVSSAGLVSLNRDAMTEQVLRTHSVAARGVGGRVESFLQSRRVALEGAAQILSEQGTGPSGQDVLSALLRSDLGILGVIVQDREGRPVLRVQRRGAGAVLDEILEDRRGTAGWRVSPPAREPSRGPYLSYQVTVGGAAALRAVFEGATLLDLLEPRELGNQASLVLASREGTALLGAADLREFPPEMLALAAVDRVFGAGCYGRGSASVVGAWSGVAGTDWTVLSRQPASVAETTARTLRTRSLAAVAMAAVLLLLTATIAYRTLVRPIRGLLEDQRSLLAIPPDARGSEIERLRLSFRALADRIQARQDLGEVFLGRYQVMELVGQGSMGSVFRGWDPVLRRDVALKTIRLDRGEVEPGAPTAQLLHEASHVAQLSDPNIVAVHDVVEADEVAFLAMEYVDGIDLASYLDRFAPLSVPAVVQVGLGIARGLSAAHERGIVHHDVKPGNVLLAGSGGLKIADFGVSQALSGPDQNRGFVVGTPGYLAPEAIRGLGYGPEADLFALGVILYQAATGTMPFRGRSVRALLLDTLRRPVPSLAQAAADIPRELDHLVFGLMQPTPEERLGPAQEVVRVLEGLVRRWGSVDLIQSEGRSFRWEQRPTVKLPAVVVGTHPA